MKHHGIVGEQKAEYLKFFNKTLGLNMALSDVKMITQINENGEPMAVATFSNCSKYNMEICLAARRGWTCSRRFIRECAKYAFITCGVRRLTSYVEVTNNKGINIHNRVGFHMEFSQPLKHWFGDTDGLQFVMMKEDCKWLTT